MEAAEKCLMTQHVFMALLQAMSNPGTVHDVLEEKHTDGGHDVLLAVAETILDREASFCVVGRDGEELERMIRDITGSRGANAAPPDCILDAGGVDPTFAKTAQCGTIEYPDKGATIIYLVAGFNGGPGSLSFSLKGPGIRPVMSFSVEGLSRDELCGIEDANKGLPLGMNCVFVDRMGKIVCIPRSATITDLHP
jgi:alpha-D-ribose 1-methylphosphonate 5-triphosphate synthase subunit PhnH